MSKNHFSCMIQILWMASILRALLAVPNTKIPCSSGQLNSILPPPTPHPSPNTFRRHVLRQLEIEVFAPQAATRLCAALRCPNTLLSPPPTSWTRWIVHRTGSALVLQQFGRLGLSTVLTSNSVSCFPT